MAWVLNRSVTKIVRGAMNRSAADATAGVNGTSRRVRSGGSGVLDGPEPVVAVGELGDSSVNLLIRPWCAGGDYWPLRFDLTRQLKEELEAAAWPLPCR